MPLHRLSRCRLRCLSHRSAEKPVEQSELSYHKATIRYWRRRLSVHATGFGYLARNFGRQFLADSTIQSQTVSLSVQASPPSLRNRAHNGLVSLASGVLLALISYLLHIFMDFSTGGRGAVAVAFSAERFTSPIQLFYGVRWSQGWITWHHLWTVTSPELALLTAVVGAGIIALRFRHITQGD